MELLANDIKRLKAINIEDKTFIDTLGNDYIEQVAKDYREICDDTDFQVILKILYLGHSNALDKTIFRALETMPLDLVTEITDNEFRELAKKQQVLTEFNRLTKKVIKSIKQRDKGIEIEERKARHSELIANKPPYYEKPICQDTIELILECNNLKLMLNLITNKIDIKGEQSKILFGDYYSKTNSMATLPVIILDICNDNEIKGASRQKIEDYIFNIADKNRYNPVQEMLKEHLNKDSKHLTDIYNILNLQSELEKTLFKKWCIQTVALAFNTKEKPVPTEGVLVIQGEQGTGKTTLFRKLAIYTDWFTEGATIDTRDKDSLINATSGWITELGELDSTFAKDQSALKAFITNPINKIRYPYAKTITDTPRTTSLGGTVNPKNFLKDTTGNRRYWVISAEKFDKKALNLLTADEIKDFWGYIYSLYLETPNSFRLNDIESKQLEINNREFDKGLPYEEEIRELFNFAMPLEEWRLFSPAQISNFVNRHGITAEKVGKILTKISNEERDVQKVRRNSGIVYKLPVKHSMIIEYDNLQKRRYSY